MAGYGRNVASVVKKIRLPDAAAPIEHPLTNDHNAGVEMRRVNAAVGIP
jgi:hypothetical protein